MAGGDGIGKGLTSTDVGWALLFGNLDDLVMGKLFAFGVAGNGGEVEPLGRIGKWYVIKIMAMNLSVY